jgi:hypothetical protein
MAARSYIPTPVVVFAFIWLAGCTPSPDQKFAEEVMERVRMGLKDPESAQFKDLQVFPEANVACGKVNAKNSMGGYVGFEEFSYNLGSVHLESTDMRAKVDGTMMCLAAEAERAIVDLRKSTAPNKEELIKSRQDQIDDLKRKAGILTSD